MRNKAARLLLAAGAGLVIFSLALFWFGSSADRAAGESARSLLEQYEAPTLPPPSPRAESAPSLQTLPEDVLGVLSIPSLSLRLPVLAEYSEDLLERSVCRYAGAAPDSAGFVIAGHSYESHFGKLSHLDPGDEVSFVAWDGTHTVYRVERQEFLSGDDPEGLDETAWDLTLFTCTFDGSDRLLVRCSRDTAS